MSSDDPKAVVLMFNGLINAQDASGLASLMTDDHVFIDSAGQRIAGTARCREAWETFFESFPDYRNDFRRFEVSGNRVTIVGRSVCSDTRLDGPAIWTARVLDGRVAEWRVYEYTESNRKQLGLSD